MQAPYPAVPPALITLLALFTAGVSQAAEYSLDYKVEGRYEYDDNVGLRADDEIDVSGGKVSLPVTFTRRSERLESSLMGEVASAKYNESDYDSDDQDLQGKIAYALERGQVDGHAGFKRDSTRDSEFLDTGVVGLSATRREKATAGGSGNYLISEKNGIIAGVDYSDISYDSERYQDYDNLSGYAGLTHQWSERTRLRLQGYGARFENDAQIEVTSDTVGVQAGFDSTLSEQLNMSLLAGWITTDTEYSTKLPISPPDDEDNDGYVVDGSLDYLQERFSLSAIVKHSATPSGNGYLLQTSQLDLIYRYNISERSRFRLDLVGGMSEALEDRIDNDRDYARTRLRLDYRISATWYVAGTYTYSYQDRDREDGDADSNSVYVSLIYHPGKRVWSR